MILRWLLIAAGTIAAALLATPVWADAILRPAVVVTGEQVLLGDVFDGVGDKASQPVAHAPPPGRRAVVDADWLEHVAAMNGIDWKSEDPFLQIVIERAGVTIPRQRVEQEIIAALQTEGVSADAQIEIYNRDLNMVVPTDGAATIAVRDLVYDQGSRHFSATVRSPADGPEAARIVVAGTVYDTEDVPTIAHPLAHGDVIAARDLAFVRTRIDKVRRDAILDADQIIGMTPRNTVKSGQPLTLADLQRPIAVARNALVTVVLSQGAMQLSIEGRANEAGSVGDVIRVTNTRSNQVISARVDGPGRVSVGIGFAPVPAPGGVAMAN